MPSILNKYIVKVAYGQRKAYGWETEILSKALQKTTTFILGCEEIKPRITFRCNAWVLRVVAYLKRNII